VPALEFSSRRLARWRTTQSFGNLCSRFAGRSARATKRVGHGRSRAPIRGAANAALKRRSSTVEEFLRVKDEIEGPDAVVLPF
jgi:hypothetical protein